ncbi:msrA [Symbiodinium sp. KB8]|nr:msrA [Symbiodinium sp. KB8]
MPIHHFTDLQPEPQSALLGQGFISPDFSTGDIRALLARLVKQTESMEKAANHGEQALVAAGGAAEQAGSANPTYRTVCNGDGHAESVQIEYDPDIISYQELLDAFWRSHKPKPSEKGQYRSSIWYHSEEQRLLAQASVAGGRGRGTSLVQASAFHAAEAHHQKAGVAKDAPRLDIRESASRCETAGNQGLQFPAVGCAVTAALCEASGASVATGVTEPVLLEATCPQSRMPLKGVELEVVEGITEHSSRVALKGVFQNFGDVVSCWVPPVDRRGTDKASVRFANAQAAEAAKEACDAGQVFLQGMMVKANWRSGGGRRVGNSDLGELSKANDFEDGGMRHGNFTT